MATYVECDGDWVRRPPFSLTGVRLWIFVLAARSSALGLLCDGRVNGLQPVVRVTPLAPPPSPLVPDPLAPVLLVAADIAQGRSEDPEDQSMGYLIERDIGFFVPVTRSFGGAVRTASLVPYLFVDNLSGMVAGRDIFGFPKLLAKMTFHDKALEFAADSLALATISPSTRAATTTVVSVAPVGPVGPSVPLPPLLGPATAAIVAIVVPLFGLPAPAAPGFAEVPLTFLKQFRSPAGMNAASHQSIVEAVLPLSNFQGGEVLPGIYRVTLPPLGFPRIADTLGLVPDPISVSGGTPWYTTLAAFRVGLDFELPLGTELWSAP